MRRFGGLRRALPMLGIAGLIQIGQIATTTAASAQEVGLGDPVAARGEAFGFIGGVRELSNGSVLVADPLGGALFRLDPALESIETIGSEGAGPGEYQQPDAVWPMSGDRSWLVDLGNARLTLVHADGTIGDSEPIVRSGGSGEGPMAGMVMALPDGSDDAGNVYFRGRPMGADGPRDSVELFRLDPIDGTPVPVAMLKAQEIRTQSLGGGNVRMSPIPLSPMDYWGAAPDGGVFIARAGSAAMEYVRRDGSSVRGPALDLDAIGIGQAEKLEWVEARGRNGGVMIDISIGGGGQRRTSMSRGGGGRREIAEYEWPEMMSPFAGPRVYVDSDGNGWVRRSGRAGEPAIYDVFDTRGTHLKSVRFPESRVLVGFGDGTLYASRYDEFDQQFLEKYSLP